MRLDVIPIESVMDRSCLSPQILLFNQGDLIAGLRYLLGSGHPGEASTDDQGLLIHLNHLGLKGFKEGSLGDSHPDEILCLLRCLLGLMHVDPGALIPIGHIEEVTVETCLTNRVLKQGFMSSRRTRSHHHPVQLCSSITFLMILGILRAGIEVSLGIDDMGQCPGILHHSRDIHNPADINPAVADEGTDTGPLIIHILLRNIFLLGDQCPSCLGEKGEASAATALAWATVSGTSLGRKDTADKDPRFRGLQRRKDGGFSKTVLVEINPKNICHLLMIPCRSEANGEDDSSNSSETISPSSVS